MTSPTGIPIMDAALSLIEATANQVIKRLDAIGEWGTAGPADYPHPIDVVHAPAPRWDNGWWAGAIRKPAHPGRVGGAISPWATVVHTTDMPAEDWSALVSSWTSKPGEGACAHFLIGRDEQAGVLQMAPIVRNANHAGGPGHGVFDTATKTGIHPNLVCVGIEVHCAGGLRKINGAWRFVEDGACHGAPIPDADVIPDPQRPGRGWHRVTEYQYTQLGALLDDLESVLAPLPKAAMTQAFGETPDAFAVMPTARVVTHAQLDPVHRADPWKPTCDWLRARHRVTSG